MFCFYNPHSRATEYILRKIISDRDLFDKMKNRGTNIIRLFSLISKYNEHFGYHIISVLKVTECGILDYSNGGIVPLEDSMLTSPSLYLRLTVLNDKNPDIRKKLAEDLTEDKTKLDIFINGILAINSSDLVLSCINKIQGLNEEGRNRVNRLQKSNMLDKVLNKDDTTLGKLTLKELLKLSILQEKESTKLESPQISSVEHCNGR
ncbi:hypothetical protein IYZ83_001535 [Wolbachia pipientis]|uniref:hypothetical protein n=1 Tax=Wolbachia pipientis TaxID=955 RepID=UPI001F36CF21|nr:hypothetical protein [Wolbachia pipientis]UIP91915.1 hypothetical protein IYZ83_001535 [Wolbachia pipientis]